MKRRMKDAARHGRGWGRRRGCAQTAEKRRRGREGEREGEGEGWLQ